MESQQSTSKKVNFGNKRVKWGDPDYEEQLLKWLEEVEENDSDGDNDCEEDFAINSDHETDSEQEGKSGM